MFLFWLKHKDDDCYKPDCDCWDCNLYDVCFYRPWFYKILDSQVWLCNGVERIKSVLQNVVKKKYVCSKCGLIEIPTGKYAAICDSYGWRKKKGLWICHHCDAHHSDCVKLDELGNQVEISQEEFDKNWQEYVNNNNKKYGCEKNQ